MAGLHKALQYLFTLISVYYGRLILKKQRRVSNIMLTYHNLPSRKALLIKSFRRLSEIWYFYQDYG